MHLSWLHHNNVNQPLGQFYFGGGPSWTRQKGRTGSTASGFGFHATAGFQWRSGFLLETRYTHAGRDQRTDLGGWSLLAGYRF